MPEGKPNVLIILADDIGWFDISCYHQGMMGSQTPNVDRLAAEGVRLTDCYGQASCTAGRAALITGQIPMRTGLTTVGLPGAPKGIQPEDPTLAELLQPQGYMTAQIGKNHLGDRNEYLPTVHGFDEFFGNLVFAWGNEHSPDGQMMANTWQGEFPWQNLKLDGYEGSSPVGSFPPNGYGLYDITGNVWEWTTDWFTTHHEVQHACCLPNNPRAATPQDSYAAEGEPGSRIPRKVIKGGSHLCAPNYCLRYRPAARQPQMIDTGTAHLGFRCIARPQ